MTDPFEVLGLDRRPLLDLVSLRRAFFEASRRLHPDRNAGKSEEFLRVREAYETLRNPAARLRALVALAGKPHETSASPAATHEDLFPWVASAAQAARQALAPAAASTPLLGALRAARQREALDKVKAALKAIESAEQAAYQWLESLDNMWPRVARSELEALAGRFRFLASSRREMEEWLLKLTTLPRQTSAHG